MTNISAEDVNSFSQLSVAEKSEAEEAGSVEVRSGKQNNNKKKGGKAAEESTAAAESGNGAGKRKVRPPRVVPIPDGLPTVLVTLDPARTVCFYGNYHFLSTFYRCRLEVNGVLYPSVEQYYQAVKLYALLGPAEASQLRFCKDAFKAKAVAKQALFRARVPFAAVEGWKRSKGLEVLLYATGLKFILNAPLRQQLLDTHDSLLVHTYEGDNFLACGLSKDNFDKYAKEHKGKQFKVSARLISQELEQVPENFNDMTLKHFPLVGQGQNVLGFVLMKVRQLLRDVPTAQLYDKAFVEQLLLRMVS